MYLAVLTTMAPRLLSPHLPQDPWDSWPSSDWSTAWAGKDQMMADLGSPPCPLSCLVLAGWAAVLWYLQWASHRCRAISGNVPWEEEQWSPLGWGGKTLASCFLLKHSADKLKITSALLRRPPGLPLLPQRGKGGPETPRGSESHQVRCVSKSWCLWCSCVRKGVLA